MVTKLLTPVKRKKKTFDTKSTSKDHQYLTIIVKKKLFAYKFLYAFCHICMTLNHHTITYGSVKGGFCS